MATPADVLLGWFVVSGFNLVVAFMIGGTRPRRLPNIVAAGLIGSNGVVGIMQGFVYWYVERGQELGPGNPMLPWIIAINTISLVAFIVFPFVFPRRILPRLWELALLVIVAATLVAVWVLLAIPGLIILNGFDDPILRWLSFVPFFLGLAAGVFILLDTYLASPSGAQRTQAFFILVAYVLKTSSYITALWNPPLLGIASFASFVDPTRLAITVILLTALFSVPAALLVSRLRGRPSPAGPRPYGHDMLLLASCAAGLTIFAQGVPALAGWWEYMFFRPVLFAYGVLQFQLLDVDIRNRRGIVSTAVLLGLASAYLMGIEWGAFLGLTSALAVGFGLVLALAGGGLLLWPLVRVLFTPEGEVQAPDPRGRELYKVALEEAVAAGEGHATSNRRILDAMRSRLQISEREHALMEASARALFGRDGVSLADGQKFLGRYRVEKVLGEGGFGRTLLAHDETVGRKVVLKVARLPTKEEARRMLKEARLLARLGHPKVITIFDVEEVSGEVILVLEYLEGGSLADRLRKRKAKPDEVARIMLDVLDGLAATHAAGIVHRDIKPENILLTKDGQAKVSDFGIARSPPGLATATGMTIPGEQPGSLLYMSPEQVRGTPLDARSDLYSLGVVVYEMLAGRPYLELAGRVAFDVRLAIIEDPPRLPIAGVPAPWNAILRALLAKDPGGRPKDAESVRQAILAIPGAMPPAPGPRPRFRPTASG